MAATGSLSECPGDATYEWKIKDFSTREDKIDERTTSPRFYFSGTSWEIGMYLNGQTEYKSEGYIGLHLTRMSTGFPLSLWVSLGFKKVDGEIDPCLSGPEEFDFYNVGVGKSKFLSREKLIERKSELLPSDTLTIICTLKNTNPINVDGSLCHRLQCLSDTLKEIYEKRMRTDLVLNVCGGDIAAHRVILEARSPALAALFNEDGCEKDYVCIDDTDISTMKVLFDYIYYADFGRLTIEKAVSVYAAAEKYEMKEVKDICLEFIKRHLTVELVCDVIKFAELFQINDLRQLSWEFFQENASAIINTKKWKAFEQENQDLSVELLGSFVKNLTAK